jgi:hypothetical protein
MAHGISWTTFNGKSLGRFECWEEVFDAAQMRRNNSTSGNRQGWEGRAILIFMQMVLSRCANDKLRVHIYFLGVDEFPGRQ